MPSLLGGDESIGVKVTTSANTRGIDDTTNSLHRLSRSGDGGSTSFLKLSAAVAAGEAIFTAAKKAFDIAGWAIGGAENVEMLRTNFDTLLGSADKGRQLFSELQTMANVTPFETADLAQATQLLLSYGLAQDRVLPALQQLGDISLGNREKLNSLALAYGQIQSKGRLMGQELLQLTNVGFNPLQKISERTGESMTSLTKKMENGQITFEMVSEEFKRATAVGGQFFGGMDKGSKTLPGLFSTLRDGASQAARSMVGLGTSGDVVQGGLYDRLKSLANDAIPAVMDASTRLGPEMVKLMDKFDDLMGSVKKIAEQVGNYLGPKFEALWKTIKNDLIPALDDFWHKIIEPLIPILGTTLVVAFGAVVDAVNALFKVISPLIDFLSNNQVVFWALVTVLGAIKLAMIIDSAAAGFNLAIMSMNSTIQTFTKVGLAEGLAQFKIFRALTTSPIVMPAIVVAAAIAAFDIILNKYYATKATLENTQKAIDSAINSQNSVIQRLQAQTKAPYSPEMQAQAKKTLAGLRATGAFADGGFTGPGSRNEIAGVVHKGEYVVPQKMVDQSTGLPKPGSMPGAGVTIYQTNNNYTQYDLDMANRELGYRLAIA